MDPELENGRASKCVAYELNALPSYFMRVPKSRGNFAYTKTMKIYQ